MDQEETCEGEEDNIRGLQQQDGNFRNRELPSSSLVSASAKFCVNMPSKPSSAPCPSMSNMATSNSTLVHELKRKRGRPRLDMSDQERKQKRLCSNRRAARVARARRQILFVDLQEQAKKLMDDNQSLRIEREKLLKELENLKSMKKRIIRKRDESSSKIGCRHQDGGLNSKVAAAINGSSRSGEANRFQSSEASQAPPSSQHSARTSRNSLPYSEDVSTSSSTLPSIRFINPLMQQIAGAESIHQILAAATLATTVNARELNFNNNTNTVSLLQSGLLPSPTSLSERRSALLQSSPFSTSSSKRSQDKTEEAHSTAPR